MANIIGFIVAAICVSTVSCRVVRDAPATSDISTMLNTIKEKMQEISGSDGLSNITSAIKEQNDKVIASMAATLDQVTSEKFKGDLTKVYNDMKSNVDLDTIQAKFKENMDSMVTLLQKYQPEVEQIGKNVLKTAEEAVNKMSELVKPTSSN